MVQSFAILATDIRSRSGSLDHVGEPELCRAEKGESMQRLAGKSAIITGAASGIGRGTAEVFAEHGARLALIDRDGPGLEQALAGLAAQGAQVVAFEGDVSQAAVIDGVVALALASFGQIDIVFNNAGIMPFGDLASFSETTWDEVMDVNVKAMYLMCKAVIPHMLARGTGSIVN